MCKFRFNYIFQNAWTNHFHDTQQTAVSDIDSLLNLSNLFFVFHSAQSMHDWSGSVNSMMRIFFTEPFRQAHFTRLYLNGSA